jgi:hypothetical protein
MPTDADDVRSSGKTGSARLTAKATRMTQTSNVPIKETILEHGLVGAPALIE